MPPLLVLGVFPILFPRLDVGKIRFCRRRQPLRAWRGATATNCLPMGRLRISCRASLSGHPVHAQLTLPPKGAHSQSKISPQVVDPRVAVGHPPLERVVRMAPLERMKSIHALRARSNRRSCAPFGNPLNWRLGQNPHNREALR